MIGSGDCCQLCTVSGSLGQVSVTAAGPPAVAAANASAVVTYAAAAHGIHAACSDSHWGPIATAFAPAYTASYHFDDSSSIAHRASELGTASSSVCFTSSPGVPVVILAGGSPTVQSTSDGLHTGSVTLAICA